jgi:predicted lipoprotein with Yx(FWY)xxD motif
MTLYFFARDRPGSGNSTCYGQCAGLWPVFVTDTPVVSPPLAASDFSVITRTDGSRQTVYKGWPLYFYQKDAKPGDMTGEGVNGNWFVAKPDYTVMLSQQTGAGMFLTDGSGRTLYYFASDKPGATACTGTCLANWPAFASGPLVAPSVLKTADFSGGKRPDGNMQSLYQNKPLYYFIKDTKPGDMNGQGVNNVWFVANMSGFVPAVPATVATTPPTPTPAPTRDYGSDSGGSSGGGY